MNKCLSKLPCNNQVITRSSLYLGQVPSDLVYLCYTPFVQIWIDPLKYLGVLKGSQLLVNKNEVLFIQFKTKLCGSGDTSCVYKGWCFAVSWVGMYARDVPEGCVWVGVGRYEAKDLIVLYCHQSRLARTGLFQVQKCRVE